MDEWERPDDLERPPKNAQGWLIAVGALVLLGIGGAVYWRLGAGGKPNGPPDAGPAAAMPIGPDAASPPVLSLADGDALLRKLAAEGSKSPLLLKWLAEPEILQRLAAATRLVSNGASPRSVLSFLEIEGEFAVIEHVAPGVSRKGTPGYIERVVISPKAYARYDALTAAITSIDPAFAGRAYVQLRPYFDSAFAEVAGPGERFDDVFKSAIQRLVSVKVPEGPVQVVPRGALYLFKEPSLESLGAAEKHLIRMGPKNAKALQDMLRKFAASAGLQLAP